MADGQPPDRLPTYTNIHAWLRTWLSRAKEDDLVLIYFAGHGRVHKGKPLLVPEDATLDTLDVSGIPVEYVQEMLLRCKAKQKVLVLDACHSGAGRDVATMTADFRKTIASGEGIYTMASCDEAELSHEWPEKGQGAFTHFLAEALAATPANAQGLVTLDAVYSWVQNKVQAWAAARRLSQNPVRICRTRGEIAIAWRPLTTEQQLQQALAEVESLKDTVEELRDTRRELDTQPAATLESDQSTKYPIRRLATKPTPFWGFEFPYRPHEICLIIAGGLTFVGGILGIALAEGVDQAWFYLTALSLLASVVLIIVGTTLFLRLRTREREDEFLDRLAQTIFETAGSADVAMKGTSPDQVEKLRLDEFHVAESYLIKALTRRGITVVSGGTNLPRLDVSDADLTGFLRPRHGPYTVRLCRPHDGGVVLEATGRVI
jgi:hypothetical protein